MEPRPKRNRIVVKSKGQPAISDEHSFVQNLCSDNARMIQTNIEKITIDLWFDKHYHDRQQHGDENGKRMGIEPSTVEKLVLKSVKHLMFYSSVVRGFMFINIKDDKEKKDIVKVVIQQVIAGTMLNIVIETYFKEIDHYEVTVKTAMWIDDFRITMGQYAIELQEVGSVLRKSENKKLIEICNL